MNASLFQVGDIYLLVGGIQFDKEAEDIRWQNQYLSPDKQLPVREPNIQILVKFDRDLNVIFEHGWFPKHEGKTIAGVNCNLQGAMSIDMHDSVYISQTFCSEESPEFRAGKVFINKFNWKCPEGTQMDWDDMMCLPDRVFCRCGFSVAEVYGIGLQCYQYVGHEFKQQELEINEMLKMDYPRLNYWAAVCVRSMNYEIGTVEEREWIKLLKQIQLKSANLRHAADAHSVVDGRYKARTRGSPPTFTHIHDDISSFIDDLQPIDSEIIYKEHIHEIPAAVPSHFVPPAPTLPPQHPTMASEESVAPTEATSAPTKVPTHEPTDATNAPTSKPTEESSPALVLSFSWGVLSWDLAHNFLPFLHDFGRNTIMLKYYLEMASWNVEYGENFVGEYIHNGVLQLFSAKSMIKQSLRSMVDEVSRVLMDQQIRYSHDADSRAHTESVINELQRQQRVLSSKLTLFRERSKMYRELALDETIEWDAINELNDTVRDVQACSLLTNISDFWQDFSFLKTNLDLDSLI